jgi:hypothetical protein
MLRTPGVNQRGVFLCVVSSVGWIGVILQPTRPSASLLQEWSQKRSHGQSACDEERNLQLPEVIYQMEGAFPWNISTSAHDWGQVLRFQGKSGSHFGSFTSSFNHLQSRNLNGLTSFKVHLTIPAY